MTTRAQLRRAASSLPEVEEKPHFGHVAYYVNGKGFASVDKDDRVLLHLPDEEAEATLTELPTAERLIRMGTPIGLAVPLADIDGQQLNALVRRAWFARAPKRLGSALAQADSGEMPHDLPASIGRPATAALLGAGITTLSQVGARTDAELLALHGVGPKAVRLLRDEIERRGSAGP